MYINLISAPVGSAHPDYLASWNDDLKHRYVLDSGRAFVEKYLEKHSSRESTEDFNFRKKITPPSADAKSAVKEIRNALAARLPSVTRRGGDPTYQSAVGTNVDGYSNSMNSFMARYVLNELLFMGKVGVFIDKEPRDTAVDNSKVPYLYVYKKEQILNWNHDNDGTLVNVLLSEQVYTYDPTTGLPTGTEDRTRQFRLLPNGVEVTINGTESEIQDWDQIPFVILELEESLVKDVADYQIALMNMESSDIAYSLHSNFPFYTEQGSPGLTDYMRPATEAATAEAGTNEIKVGNTQGRRYAPEMDRPQFIAPPSDPLKISIEKEKQIREQIIVLLHLTLTNLRPVRLSSDAKAQEFQGMEAGMFTIGYALEQAENRIASIWSMYQESPDVAVVKYPTSYAQMAPSERVTAAESRINLAGKTPSVALKKALHEEAAHILTAGIASQETVDRIIDEIKRAKILNVDPERIREDHEAGLVSTKTASVAVGYPMGEAAKAAVDHAARLARIAAAQSSGDAAARLSDTSDPESRKNEKTDSQQADTNDKPATRTRGDA